MLFLARLWLFCLACAVITIALSVGGCQITVTEPPRQAMKIDKACPHGLTHDECVVFKHCSKFPKICAAE